MRVIMRRRHSGSRRWHLTWATGSIWIGIFTTIRPVSDAGAPGPRAHRHTEAIRLRAGTSRSRFFGVRQRSTRVAGRKRGWQNHAHAYRVRAGPAGCGFGAGAGSSSEHRIAATGSPARGGDGPPALHLHSRAYGGGEHRSSRQLVGTSSRALSESRGPEPAVRTSARP